MRIISTGTARSGPYRQVGGGGPQRYRLREGGTL